MDIIIPIHSKTGEELRYTLRGIAQHATGYDTIILLGTPPEWVTNLTYLPISDITSNPFLNQYAKCLAIEKDFTLFNDDFFLTAPTDFRLWVNKFQNNLSWRIDQAKNHRDYQLQLMATSRLCSEQLRSHLNFELHAPMIIERKALDFMRGNAYGAYQFRSVSGNFSKKYPSKPDYDVHFKSSKALQDIPNWKEHVTRAGHFSGGTAFMDRRGIAMLEQLYPKKCKFEI